MQLLLFSSFNKRRNSTKQPDITKPDKTYTVYLKIQTDYDAPTFLIMDESQTLPIYTYAYLVDFQRFYFVSTCKQRNSKCWEIDCQIDVLATYKSQIRLQTLFVAYSTTDYSLLVNDGRIPKKTASTILTSSPYSTVFGDNNYDFLWVAGENGTVCYRCNVKQITEAIYQAANQSLLDNLCQTWADIQSCILYCRSFSLDSQSSGTAESVIIGKYDTEEQGVRVSDEQLKIGHYGSSAISITIPHTYTDFRRITFSSMKLELPFIGVINLSMSDFVTDPTAEASVHIEYILNLGTGVIVYKISNDDGAIIATYNGIAGRSKPVSIYTPFSGQGVVTSSFGTTVAAGALMFASAPATIAAGIAGSIAGFASLISATEQASSSTIGTNDGSCEEKLNSNIQLTVEEFDSHIEPSSLLTLSGGVCGKVRSLTGLSGYVKTEGAQVDLIATSNIIDELNTQLDNGIYIE